MLPRGQRDPTLEPVLADFDIAGRSGDDLAAIDEEGRPTPVNR